MRTISSVSVSSAVRAYGPDGGRGEDDVRFEKTEASDFVEWGATERLTLLAQPVVQYVTLTRGGSSTSAAGLAASQIGARLLLARRGGGVASVQGALVAAGQAENLTDAEFGDGGTAAEARLLLGRGWGDEAGRGAFVEGQIGHRWRLDDSEPEESRLDVAVGLRPSRRWLFMAQSFSAWTEAAPALSLDETESHKAQLSTVLRVNSRVSLQAGGYATVAGRSIVEEKSMFAALWLRFPP